MIVASCQLSATSDSTGGGGRGAMCQTSCSVGKDNLPLTLGGGGNGGGGTPGGLG
jgi:hypothetical protein